MLVELSIINFALIERLELSFGPGFNVLTGETGAGKSIIVGAVGLILGGRAASDLIRDGYDEAEVTAVFSAPEPGGLDVTIEELGLPMEENIFIRRVISRTGRNRVYINGAPAALNQLARLSQMLISVSGQYEHQELLNPDRQLLVLDQYGRLHQERVEMGLIFNRLTELKNRASALERKIKQARDAAELHEYQAREIETAELHPGEDEELAAERDLIRNAEKIYSMVQTSFERLYGDAGSVSEALGEVRRIMAQTVELDGRLKDQAALIDDSYYQIEEAARSLKNHLDALTFDPERQEEVEERLALINRLKRKYGASLEEVIAHGASAEASLTQLAELEQELGEIKNTLQVERARAEAAASALSLKRRKAAEKMSEAVVEELSSLGMPQLKFEIRFNSTGKKAETGMVEPGPAGWDVIEYLISPNLGEDLKPLSQIASGGELSRTLLGLNALLAGQNKVMTLVFDEVDSGIGGAVAEAVGRKIKGLSRFHQVLCITHLPQIAAFAENHHHVFKEVRGQRTVTDIRPLPEGERVREVARMIGGLKPSEKTLDAAREMVARAGGDER